MNIENSLNEIGRHLKELDHYHDIQVKFGKHRDKDCDLLQIYVSDPFEGIMVIKVDVNKRKQQCYHP